MVALVEPKIDRDLRTLVRFIQIYCDGKHATRKIPVQLKAIELTTLAQTPVRLCPECMRLLIHAVTKRMHCPMDPKPACKNCPQHCYHPKYRAQIRNVMKYAGPRLLLSGRFDYLFRLLF